MGGVATVGRKRGSRSPRRGSSARWSSAETLRAHLEARGGLQCKVVSDKLITCSVEVSDDEESIEADVDERKVNKESGILDVTGTEDAQQEATVWEYPPARPGAPGRRAYGRGSVAKLAETLGDPEALEQARLEYEDDKLAQSSKATVKSHMVWWSKRAQALGMQPYPLTVEKLRSMGALLKKAGYRSAAAYFGAVKRKHVRLGHRWSEAMDLEVRDGTRACTRGIGPPQKCGAFDLEKLVGLEVMGGPVYPGGPRWPREGALCGCWWAMREVELATTRCKQVSFVKGPGCGVCEIDLPVSKSDVQALGKRRRLSGASEAERRLGEALCPVKVVRMLWDAAREFSPPGAEAEP